MTRSQNMNNLYLILHKVSGSPALDVACKLETTELNGEEMWIIPTSGHRAYPYRKWSLTNLPDNIADMIHNQIPAGWPDHYQNARHVEPSLDGLFKAVMSTVPKFLRRA
jgi:hypothetical protein